MSTVVAEFLLALLLVSGASGYQDAGTEVSRTVLLTSVRVDCEGAAVRTGPESPPLPGWDTLYWHDGMIPVPGWAHGGPTSGDAWLFGLGVKLTPREYPAVVRGISHRVYRDPESPTGGLMQFRIVDDDGPGGAPQTVLFELDTIGDPWDWYFHFLPLPAPYDTISDGSFYFFVLSRDTGRVSYTLLWARDLYLEHLEKHWWHQHGEYNVCTSILGDLYLGVVVYYPGVGVAEVLDAHLLPGSSDLDGWPSVFRSSARIRYALPRESAVELKVHDACGNLVRVLESGIRGPGCHSVSWDGRDEWGRETGPGPYFCCLNCTGSERVVARLVKLD